MNALIENPAFDSQTKENLTTKPSAFGSPATLSEALLKRVERSGGNAGEWEPCSMAETCAEFGAAPLRPGVR